MFQSEGRNRFSDATDRPLRSISVTKCGALSEVWFTDFLRSIRAPTRCIGHKKTPPILSEAHGKQFGFRYRPKRHFPTSTYTDVIEAIPGLQACTPGAARS